ncbi:oligomeric complex COG6-domain-containing protein [Gorgonomyces haynaldii]|nr:oligomeric complex COG6-domain-containing protein [Gorgonomyces haynaldii]
MESKQLPKQSILRIQQENILHLSLDKELLDALDLFSDASNVKEEMERKEQEAYEALFDLFKSIESQMFWIQSHLLEMDLKVDQTQEQIQSIESSISPVLIKKKQLERLIQTNRRKQQELNHFMSTYTLSSDEIQTLVGPDLVSELFFEALDRLQLIMKESRHLLAQDLGLELIKHTSQYQEQAYEKLYRWLMVESKILKEESPEITVSFRKGVVSLRSRPILSFMQDIVVFREKTTSLGFQQALSVGGSSSQKPIEIHAHDPQRYLGDMLAWIHQQTLTERELLEGLFGLKSSAELKQRHIQMDPTSPIAPVQDEQQMREQLFTILDRIMKGPAQILLARSSPLFMNLQSLDVLGLFQILSFYLETFQTLIPGSELLQIIQSLKMFDAAQDFKSSVQQLGKILVFYDTMLNDPQAQQDLEQIWTILYQPLFDYATQTTGKTTVETLILRVNALSMLEQQLHVSFSSQQLQDIQTSIEEQLQALAQEQRLFVLQQSGLYDVILASNAPPPLSHQARTSRSVIVDALLSMDRFLITANLDLNSLLSQVRDPHLTKKVLERGLSLFLEDYKSFTSFH